MSVSENRDAPQLAILFVCLGNICRSPTAEAVFRTLVKQQEDMPALHIDSAGTAGWHAGKAPDPRAVAAGAKRGYDLSTLTARQAVAEDFLRFDYVLAMDRRNLENLKAIEPANHQAQLKLFLDYHPDKDQIEVPDPYHGGAENFAKVLDLVETACQQLIAELKQRQI